MERRVNDPVAGSRWLTRLAWASLLLLAAAWVFTARHPWIGFYERWSQWPEWSSMAAALLLVPLIGVVTGSSRTSRRRRIAIGVAGFAAMVLLGRGDLLAISIVELQQRPREPSFCSYRPPMVPLLAYSGVGWLPLVLRAQAEACTLVELRAAAEAMWLRRRWLVLGFAVLLSAMLSEAVFFVGVQVCQGSRFDDLQLLAIAPMLALLLFEMLLRASRTTAPRYEAVATDSKCWSVPARPLADPVALQRGHTALRLARTIAVVAIAIGLLVLCGVLASHVLDGRPWHFSWLLVSGLALLAIIVLGCAPRPRPDPRRRPPAPSYELSDRLRALLSTLERMQAMVEQGRELQIWTLRRPLQSTLASLTEQDRELLEHRHAELERLLAALRVLEPITDSIDRTPRRALHAELVRFIACARDLDGEAPYRNSKDYPRFERLPVATLDAALRIPGWWVLGALLLCFAVIVSVALALELERFVIAVPAVALLLYASALAYARRMFEVAVLERGPAEGPARYSAAFEHAATRVRSSRRRASVIATVVVMGLWALTITAAVCAGAVLDGSVKDGELFVGASVLAAGVLGLRPLRDRLREWPAVAMVRRLHRAPTVSRASAVIIELVAQRLAWAEAPHLEVEALERCAELLHAATELGTLASEDRECLVTRLGDAIARGPALGSRQQRAIELELATAERLLASPQ